MANILVTGGCGFIGSNFMPYFLEKYPEHRVVNLDKLTYAGSLSNLKELAKHPRYWFMHGDIANREMVEYVFRDFSIEGVIHFAAESHVDNSIEKPDVFMQTNVLGTFTLLDVARKIWKEPYRFHHISTDEVYGSLERGLASEETPYAPNSPYSASKASADMIARSYFHTYGLNVVTTNCSNNYGPKQHGEKLIPTIIRKALVLEPIPIYGDGKNVRDWLYVMDHCKAIDLVFHKGVAGQTYNVGARNEWHNLDLAYLICGILDEFAPQTKSYRELITFVTDRLGHDRRYALNPTKVEHLGWKPEEDFGSGLRKTVEWYLGR